MKFNHKHYVPILKGKQGELDAIRGLTANVRAAFTPLIEIPPVPPKWLEGQDEPIPGKTIDQHVDDVGAAISDSIGQSQAIFIDGAYIQNEANLATGGDATAGVFARLRSAHVPFIPVVGLDRTAEYGAAVRDAIATDGRGCCLRLQAGDLESIGALVGQIDSLLAFLQIAPQNTHLVVDFGPDVPLRAALIPIINAIPRLNEWETFTITASSFLENMSGVARQSIETFDRDEWLAWTFIREHAGNATRMPAFGDYAINHPIQPELDPRLIRMSPNIRYTGELVYVIAKGQAYPRKKDGPQPALKGSEQYPRLAQMIVEHEEWCGQEFSWGDSFIFACSRRECVGSSTNWRAVGTNHHIAFVVQQLANLP